MAFSGDTVMRQNLPATREDVKAQSAAGTLNEVGPPRAKAGKKLV